MLDYCQSTRHEMLKCLEAAVKIESPTFSKPDVDRMADFFAGRLRKEHGKVRVLRHGTAGSAVLGEFWGEKRRGAKPILILGHLDTVWETGTLQRMPFRIRGGRAYGPGIFDMKSGIVCGLWAIRALQACGIEPTGAVRFFLNSDEETSSVAFRNQLLAEARRPARCSFLSPPQRGAP